MQGVAMHITNIDGRKTADPVILRVLEHLNVSTARLDTVIQKIVSNTRYEQEITVFFSPDADQ